MLPPNQDPDAVLATVRASGGRRSIGLAALGFLGLFLIYLAFSSSPGLGWQAFLIVLGVLALWMAERMRRATASTIELTSKVIRDSDGTILAHVADIAQLKQAFREGQDIHAAVAAQIHDVPLAEVSREQRNGAKMVNFGIVYGVTAFGLARRLGVSNSEAGEIIDGYKRRFAGITTFLEECIAQAHAQGYVETMMKRRRPIPDIDSRDQNRRALAERMAINSVVQGSAADLIKIAMVDLHRRLSPRAAAWREGAGPEIEGVRMLLQIHDELVFEAPEDRAEAVRDLIVARMEAAMALDVPLVADASVSGDWFGAK